MTVNSCILALKIAALSNVKCCIICYIVTCVRVGNVTSGKKEGVITGCCKYREKPVETTTFPVGQILAVAISSDGKFLVGCSIRVSTMC